jgi:hypothetical protein
MKPEIYELTDDQGMRNAWLIDSDSLFLSKNDAGAPCMHFPVAVDIGDQRVTPGVIRTITTFDIKRDGQPIPCRVRVVIPRPCVLALNLSHAQKNTLEWRGIHPTAAEVLLKLAASGMSVNASFANGGSWEIGGPSTKGAFGWGGMKFMVAWRWSNWIRHGYTGEQRLEEMKMVGYPGTAESLRVMCSRLGLVTRNS